MTQSGLVTVVLVAPAAMADTICMLRSSSPAVHQLNALQWGVSLNF